MRGRLIFPFLADVAQIQTHLMAADPDGPGPLESGYDEDFREPVVLPTASDDRVGAVRRVEKCVRLPAQIETRTIEQLRMAPSGASPNQAMELVFHFKDLERLGLVDETSGVALLRVNDRLASIREIDGSFIQEFPNPPGLFAMEVQPSGFGFGKKRNLLIVTFEERETGTRVV